MIEGRVQPYAENLYVPVLSDKRVFRLFLPAWIMMEIQDDSKERWYVLRLPRSNVRAGEELEQEALRRRGNNLPPLKYFAPVLLEFSETDGGAKTVRKPFCLNYVFIYSTVYRIRLFRQAHPDYNLIHRRSRNAFPDDYLYVRDHEMKMFMIMARVYKDAIPCCPPDRQMLGKGDKVRIIGGCFAGVEGILMTEKGKDGGRVVINVCNRLMVPTLSIRPEYIKVISFSGNNRHVYKKLDSYYPRIRRAMHNCLKPEGLDDTDRKNVSTFLARFGDLDMPSDKTRGRYLAFMLMSHKVLGHEEDSLYYVVRCARILPEITNETTRAFVLSALYACTKDVRYGNGVEEITAKWHSRSLSRKQEDVLEDFELYRKYVDYDGNIVK